MVPNDTKPNFKAYHRELARLLREKGSRKDSEFSLVRIEGGSHDKPSWRPRFRDAFRFVARCQKTRLTQSKASW